MKRAGGSVFKSLRTPNYRIWAAGALVSNIGTWMQRAAQDWLVLTQLTANNASAVGIVMALQFGPQLLLLPWTGLVADRYPLRRILLVTQALSGLLALGLGVLTLTGLVTLWQVYLFALLFGCTTAFDAPARQIFVGELVDERELPNAVSLNSTSFNLARLVGPAVSGLVIASIGTGWSFMINGLSFVAVLIALICLRADQLHRQPRAARRAGNLAEGMRLVWQRDDLRTMSIMLFLIGTFGLNFPIFISTMAVRTFGADASAYGLLSSVMAIGTVSGALLAAGRERLRFRLLVTSSLLFCLGCTLAALAPGYWWFAVTLVLIGSAALTFTNATNSLTQLATEPALRGRVMAIRMAILMGCTPLGAPLVGYVADMFGPRWALGVAALSGILSALVGFSYLRRQAVPAVTA